MMLLVIDNYYAMYFYFAGLLQWIYTLALVLSIIIFKHSARIVC